MQHAEILELSGTFLLLSRLIFSASVCSIPGLLRHQQGCRVKRQASGLRIDRSSLAPQA
jgi:hypothetical protein